MKKISFNDKFSLTESVLDGRKTQFRKISNKPIYKVNEILAISQNYWDIMHYYHGLGHVSTRVVSEKEQEFWYAMDVIESTGDDDAMRGDEFKKYTKANLMPHHIKITNIRFEKLQDISNEDALKEGIYVDNNVPEGWTPEKYIAYSYDAEINHNKKKWWFESPIKAFIARIEKTYGKDMWDKNPNVVVYEFELID